MKRSFTPFLLSIMLGLSLIMAGSLSNAQAALLTFEFQGNVNSVGPLFPTPSPILSQFDTTQELTGTFTFDTTTVNSSPPFVPQLGMYNGAITDMSFSIGSYNFNLGNTNLINILDDFNGLDGFNASTTNPVGAPVAGLDPTFFDISMVALTSAGVFSGIGLPNVPPDPTAPYVLNQWQLGFSDGSLVQGMITNTKLVPLPSALLLFGSGLIGLIGLGAGRRRETTA